MEPMTEAEYINVVQREALQRFGHAGRERVLRACAEAPATPQELARDLAYYKPIAERLMETAPRAVQRLQGTLRAVADLVKVWRDDAADLRRRCHEADRESLDCERERCLASAATCSEHALRVEAILSTLRAEAPATDTADIARWRTLYRALAWMVNDYIGVTDSVDYKDVDKRLGYAHKGYHNARRVMHEHKPPMPERLQRFNDGTGCLYGGNQHPDRCVCQEKETGQFAGTPHKHYDEPPYNCARCHCKAYEPATPLRAEALAPSPDKTLEVQETEDRSRGGSQ